MEISEDLLKKQKHCDVREINIHEVSDISEITIHPELPVQERIKDYLRQTKHAYATSIDGYIVKSSFLEDGISMQECLIHYIQKESEIRI